MIPGFSLTCGSIISRANGKFLYKLEGNYEEFMSII